MPGTRGRERERKGTCAWAFGTTVLLIQFAPMFCPECEAEYREGFTTCSDCAVALVPELGVAALMPLAIAESPDALATLVDALEAANVPYVVEAGTALRLLDGVHESLDAP